MGFVTSDRALYNHIEAFGHMKSVRVRNFTLWSKTVCEFTSFFPLGLWYFLLWMTKLRDLKLDHLPSNLPFECIFLISGTPQAFVGHFRSSYYLHLQITTSSPTLLGNGFANFVRPFWLLGNSKTNLRDMCTVTVYENVFLVIHSVSQAISCCICFTCSQVKQVISMKQSKEHWFIELFGDGLFMS